MPLKRLTRDQAFQLLVTLVTFLIFFRPGAAMKLLARWDEVCYLEWLQKFLFLQPEACYSTAHFPGIALLWLPFGGLARISSWITGAPLSVWLPAWVGLSGLIFLYFIVGALHRIGITVCKKNWSYRTTLLFYLNIPLIYYVSVKPLLAHVGHLFAAVLAIDFALRRRFWLSLIAASVCSLIRPDAIFIFLPVIGLVFDFGKKTGFTPTKPWWLTLGLVLGILGSFLFYLSFGPGYNQHTFFSMMSILTWPNTKRVFFASNWGLVWTQTLWLFTIVAGLTYFSKLSWGAKGAVAYLIVQLWVCLGWATNAGDFAYRYTVGTYAATLLLWCEIKNKATEQTRSAMNPILIYGAIWLTVLTWIYPSRFWPWQRVPDIAELGLPYLAVAKAYALNPAFSLLIVYSPLGTVLQPVFHSYGLFDKFPGYQQYVLDRGPYTLVCALTVAAMMGTVLAFRRFQRRTK